ncbi:Com family DNA-binding transcriptional regulator [Citrobacter freundii]|nr:Com family DNA-binding transcriptional regulator [Citrobacter freundii]MBC6508282.1 Com family DNA-binding transcriptional regulator [Citrobacter freundii]
MQETRCTGCNKLLFKGSVIAVQIKCPRCKRIINIASASEHPTYMRSNSCGKQRSTHPAR